MAEPAIAYGAPRPSTARGWLRTVALLLALAALALQGRAIYDVFVPRNGARVPFVLNGRDALVQRVEPEAAAAGLAEGDRILEIGGRRYGGTATVAQAFRDLQAGTTVEIVHERPGTGPRRAPIRTAPRTDPLGRAGGMVVALLFGVVLPLVCTFLGTWVVLVRPEDRLAWILLGLMLSFGQFNDVDWTGWEPGVRELGGFFSAVLNGSWPAFLLLFGLEFPQPFAEERRRPWIKWIPVGALLAHAVLVAIARVGSLEHQARMAPLWRFEQVASAPMMILGMVSTSCFFVLLGIKGSAVASSEARRRLAVLRWGATAALSPLFLLIVWSWFFAGGNFASVRPGIFVPALVALLLFPLTLAYVIVVQRAMDVRVALRLGARYLLVKNGLRILIFLGMLPLGVFFGFFVMKSRTIGPAWKAAATLGYAMLVVMVRRRAKRAMQAIDRRFFRDAYDEERVLTELSTEVQTMVEAEPLLGTVVDKIADTLHVGRLAVFVGNDEQLELAHGRGLAGRSVPPIPAEGRIRDNFTAARGKPLLVYPDDPSSWTRRLSAEERAPIEAVGAQALYPLTARGRLLGVLALGPKLSEQPFSRTDLRLLANVAAQTGLALENSRLTSAMVAENAKRVRLASELEIARDVQQRLFPQALPAVRGLELAGACRPASRVGGDYYDFLALPGGGLGIAIGDVSGKGIPAALLMASLQASLRGQTLDGVADLSRLMARINRLVHDASPDNRYATFFYAQYDLATRRLDYVNAGHNPPMLLRAARSAAPERLVAGGRVVGLLPDGSYAQGTVELRPGDLLVGFTDGISEAMSAEEEEWGEERLLDVLHRCDGVPAAEVIDRVFRAADAFVAGAPQHDDMTLVVVRCDG